MSQFFPSPHHAFLYSHSRFFSLSISIIYCVASFLHSLSLSLSVYVCVCSHLWLQTELRSRHHSPSSSPCHHHSSFLCLLYSLRESFTFFTFTQRIFRDTHTHSHRHTGAVSVSVSLVLGAWCSRRRCSDTRPLQNPARETERRYSKSSKTTPPTKTKEWKK